MDISFKDWIVIAFGSEAVTSIITPYYTETSRCIFLLQREGGGEF